MKTKVFLSFAAIAVLVASLAINVNTNNSTTSSLNLTDLVQTADADEYWQLTCLANQIGVDLYEDKWINIENYDVPFVSGTRDMCYLGGGSTCSAQWYDEYDNVIYDEEMLDDVMSGAPSYVIPLVHGVWVGGSDWIIDRAGGNDPSTYDIVNTIGNKHLVLDYDILVGM